MVQRVQVVEFASTPEQNRLISQLLILVAIGFGLKFLFNLLEDWSSFETPYNYISAFYYYGFVVPIQTFSTVWEYLSNYSFTQYPNLNTVISIVGIVIYGFIFLTCLMLAILLANSVKLNLNRLINIILTPAFLALLWFVFSYIFSWLFSVK